MSGDQFRRIRTRHLRLTQRQMADRLRVNRVTVVRWEAGQQPVPGPVAVLMTLVWRLRPAARRFALSVPAR